MQHFIDWIDDQFDFHTYCLRKMTMRAYVGLLRLEDKYATLPDQFSHPVGIYMYITDAFLHCSIHSHKYFEGAAQGMIQCYLRLFDNPVTKGSGEMEDEFSVLLILRSQVSHIPHLTTTCAQVTCRRRSARKRSPKSGRQKPKPRPRRRRMVSNSCGS